MITTQKYLTESMQSERKYCKVHASKDRMETVLQQLVGFY